LHLGTAAVILSLAMMGFGWLGLFVLAFVLALMVVIEILERKMKSEPCVRCGKTSLNGNIYCKPCLEDPARMAEIKLLREQARSATVSSGTRVTPVSKSPLAFIWWFPLAFICVLAIVAAEVLVVRSLNLLMFFFIVAAVLGAIWRWIWPRKKSGRADNA
jgi:hypothetical protein